MLGTITLRVMSGTLIVDSDEALASNHSEVLNRVCDRENSFVAGQGGRREVSQIEAGQGRGESARLRAGGESHTGSLSAGL